MFTLGPQLLSRTVCRVLVIVAPLIELLLPSTHVAWVHIPVYNNVASPSSSSS